MALGRKIQEHPRQCLIVSARCLGWERTELSLVTTDALPARQRFEYWREVVARQFIETRLEPDGGAFQAEMEARAVGGLVTARSRGSGGWAFRTEAEIDRSPASFYMANIHLGGPVSVRAGGERTSLAAGDIFFVDALRPFELGARSGVPVHGGGCA